MELNGNTILITGGGSGIGLALGEEFHRLGNEVIVAGRSQVKLEKARAKGLRSFTADMSNPSSVRELAAEVMERFPKLNVVIHNAGIMQNEKVIKHEAALVALETIATNLMAPIQLTNALLPHFLKQPSATIITVTSGLAFVPLAMTPTYSASKAAIHSYTQSLRYQLKDTRVEVKELVPPYVRTSLMGSRQAQDQNAMPLEDFVREVMTILREQPDAEEILVERVKPQRTAEQGGPEKYQQFFKAQNERLMSARKQEWDSI